MMYRVQLISYSRQFTVNLTVQKYKLFKEKRIFAYQVQIISLLYKYCV